MVINIPVIAQCDFLLLGGAVPALQTALDLTAKGAKGFGAFCRSYCAEDVMATLDPDKMSADTDGVLPPPMMVKRDWERKLIEAEIPFLYQTFPVRRIDDENGHFSGMVLSGRSGFFAVAARVLIDGSERQFAGAAAGAPKAVFAPGDYQIERITVGAPPENPSQFCWELPVYFAADKEHPELKLYRSQYTFRFEKGNWAECCQIECKMRQLCWNPKQLLAVDSSIFHLPSVVSPEFRPDKRCPFWTGREPEAVKQAQKAIAEAGKINSLHIADAINPQIDGTVVHFDNAPRYADSPKLVFHLNSLEIGGRFDVVVAGGGTAGAPATIGAVREAARVLCVENSSHLGGVTTQGRISHYWFGNKCGFSNTIDERVAEIGGNPVDHGRWNIEHKQYAFLHSAMRGGAQILFNTLAVGAVRRGKLVSGIVAATPEGCSVIECNAVIDATGNADVAAAAGAETRYSGEEEPALQGSGMPRGVPGVHYANCDYLFACDSDTLDATAAYVMGREKYSDSFDLCAVVGTRERRRIVGDLTLDPTDFLLGRCYSDTIVEASSNFDTHGFTVHGMFLLHATDEEPLTARVPYRCLLPKDLDGVLVTGLGISAHRDAMPVVRMEADVQNQGYAAGLAAGMTAVRNRTVRDLDVRELQRMLCAVGNLTVETMSETDSFDEKAANPHFAEIAAMFRDPASAHQKLSEQLKKSQDVEIAALLAMLGFDEGREILNSFIAQNSWDEGWNYSGMGQFGRAVSPLDAKILALAKIGGKKEVILQKLKELKLESAFSHFRAVSRYLQLHPDSRAIPMLEQLLGIPELTDTIPVDMKSMLKQVSPNPNDNELRNRQLKELYLLKALQKCDEHNALASDRLLRYSKALSRLYAVFASENPVENKIMH